MTAGPDHQLPLDFSRAEQLAILRDAVLPWGKAKDGSRVASALLKGTLRALDDHSRGRPRSWASQKTLAAEACCSVRQLRRAVEALGDLGLLIVQRRQVHPEAAASANFYTIVWSKLALLGRPRKAVDQSAVTADQSAVTADQSAIGGRYKRTASNRKEPPPPAPSENEPADGGADWAAAENALREAGVRFWEKYAKLARSNGETPDQVLDIVRVYQANRSKLRGPGTIVSFLRDGAWPVDGIRSPAEAKHLAETATPGWGRYAGETLEAAGLQHVDADPHAESGDGRPPRAPTKSARPADR